MKKLKKFLAILSAGTMLICGAVVLGMTASADTNADDYYSKYDFNNKAYADFIDKLEVSKSEKAIMDNFPGFSHVYNTDSNFQFYFERACGGIRIISQGSINNRLAFDSSVSVSETEINQFLTENNLKGKVKNIQKNDNGSGMITIDFDSTTSSDDFVEAVFSLKYKYGFKPMLSILYNVATFSEVLGDVNYDGIFNISDVVMLQKALSTSTATLDMDVNGDGKLNVFDVVALKRMMTENLGNVKSI